MMIAAMGMNCHAAIYLVGDFFSDWNPGNGVEMTQEDDGLYTYTATINGTIYFVFADGLDSDWTTFNNNYRYGPLDNDETVHCGYEWHSTQKSNSQGAYCFHGADYRYVFIFDEKNKQFKIEDCPEPFYCFTVTGSQNLCGSNWDPTDMTRRDDGIYIWNREVELAAGEEVEFKVVENHSWDNSWPDLSWSFTVEQSGIYSVTITFDPINKEITCLYPAVTDGPEPVFGDLDGDGSVNVADLSLLIDCILGREHNPLCDLDNDGSANVADLSLLIDLLISGNRPVS